MRKWDIILECFFLNTLFNRLCENTFSSCFNLVTSLAWFKDCKALTYYPLLCSGLFLFSECLSKRWISEFDVFFCLIPSWRQYFFRVMYSCLSILLDGNANIFVVALLMSYCNFSCLILSLMFMITPSTPSYKFFKEPRVLSEWK